MMRTRRPRARTFDELIAGYYGRLDCSKDPTVEDVVASHYGEGAARRRAGVALSLTRDDGEVLAAKPAAHAKPAAPPREEYVVCDECVPAPAPSPVSPPRDEAPTVPAPPDLLPPQPAPAPPTPPPLSPPRDVAPPAPVPPDVFPPPPAPPDVMPPPPAPPDVFPPPPEPLSGTPAAQASSVPDEDELAADMQAILSGQKVYDPATKRTVDRDQVSSPEQPPEPPPPPVETSNEQAIFDRIADSMRYANAYDLGTVDLENRFADFDRLEEARPRPKTQGANGGSPREGQPPVGGADFLNDLDAIRDAGLGAGHDAIRRAVESMPRAYSSSMADWTDDPDRDASCHPFALTHSLGKPGTDFAQPMYDTGEHVIAGGAVPDALPVGPSPGVSFTYGQIVSMPDFYESVDQMMNTDVRELTAVKALIERSTQFYATGKTTPSLEVSNEEWDRVTGGRYLNLAEENYSHFAPNTLITDAVARSANRFPDHKSSWEHYHSRAIQEAADMALRPENQNVSFIPVWPLIINAFGDHFLTDAFASGHTFNKEVMIAMFRANFYSGGSLTSDGNAFFDRVAAGAFTGEVRRRFSVLETTDHPVCAWGWCLPWNPNINSAGRFASLLKSAAEAEPVKVANFAVKALHDKLNRDGIEVTNAAGHAAWRLTGDGHMNPTSLAVMRQAVDQSIANLSDPAIRVSNINFGPFLERVWRHVPQLTPASRTSVAGLMREYTNPRSTVLSTAAGEVIRGQLDSLIRVLIERGKLQPA